MPKRKPNRVQFSRTVKPDTVKLVKRLAEHLDLSEGQTVDRAVQALAVAESFGSNHTKRTPRGNRFTDAPEEAKKVLRRLTV